MDRFEQQAHQPIDYDSLRTLVREHGLRYPGSFKQFAERLKLYPATWVKVRPLRRLVEHHCLQHMNGRVLHFVHTVATHRYDQKPWPDPLTNEQVTNIAMVSGMEHKLTKVIRDGRLFNWIGIGWVGGELATEDDYYAYPVVTP